MRDRCGVLVRALLFMTIVILPAVSHAQVGPHEVVGDVVLHSRTGNIWYRDLKYFANMTYQEQNAAIEALNTSDVGKGFYHCKSWHLANYEETWDGVKNELQDFPFGLFSTAFVPTPKVSPPDRFIGICPDMCGEGGFLSGGQNYNWLGRFNNDFDHEEGNEAAIFFLGIEELGPGYLQSFAPYLPDDSFKHPSLGAWVCCRPPPPVLEPIRDKIVIEDNTLTFTINATDPDGHSLTYSASNLPAGAQFDPATRTFTWTPDSVTGQAGAYTVKFSVWDSEWSFIRADEIITITVYHLDKIYTDDESTEFTPDGVAPYSAPVSKITFENVTTGGVTTLSLSDQQPEAPHTFKVGDPATYVLIESGALFSNATVCIDYASIAFVGSENDLKLLHYHEGVWDNATTSIDTVTKTICGTVNSFSPFVVVEPRPTADAGDNLLISTEDQDKTTVGGTVAYSGSLPLSYRWLEGTTDLSGCQAAPCIPVGTNGEAPLNLATIPTLAIGQHTLTLQVTGGVLTDTDTVIVTVGNSAPHAEPSSGSGTYQVNTPVVLSGQVSDYDGDPLSYQWLEGNVVLGGGGIQTVVEGQPVSLPELTLSALEVGIYGFTLTVSDAVNDPVSKGIIVNIIDTTAPTLAPVADKSILWPPNHQWVDITIRANAADNSGLPVTLRAVVSSNEPINGLGDGDTSPDWTDPVINQSTGVITLKLRAERSGKGSGRQYTVTIVATDASGNESTANVKIIVPHDQGKK
jgi:hypothetical protein